jgi:hypothetical protein
MGILFIGLIACNNSKNQEKELSTDLVKNPNTATGKIDKDKLPKIEFKEKEHDFGEIFQGEKVSYSFRFKNTGKSDLIISDVSASCGCTVPEYPQEPIKPGEEGSILVTFSSGNREGFQRKTVTVVSNTQPNYVHLKIKAKVKVKY